MKLKKTLSAFGLIAIAASTLMTGPASNAVEPVEPQSQVADSIVFQQMNHADGVRYFGVTTSYASDRNYMKLQSPRATIGEALAESDVTSVPAVGSVGRIELAGDLCFTVQDGQTSPYSVTCSTSIAQQWEWIDIVDGETKAKVLSPTAGRYKGYILGTALNEFLHLQTPTTNALIPRGAVVNALFSLETPAVGSTIRDARPTFSGVGTPGATIEVEDADGRPLATTTVGEDSAWSAQADEAFPEGRHTGEIRQVTADDVVTTTPYDFEYALVKDVAVTSPASGSSVNLPRPVISGTGQAGAEIELLFAVPNERTYRTTVGENGTWSITPTVSLIRGSVEGQVTQSFEGGTKQSAFNFTYGTVAPIVDVTLAAPAVGATVTDARPVFSGTGQNGATIEVVEGGNVIASATVSGGTWTATPTADVALGANAGSVNQKISGAQQSSVPFSFTREAEVVEQPLVVSSPAVGGSIVTDETGRVAPVFTGTATPGAEVKVVTAWGDVVGTVTADEAGAWSLTWNKALLPNTYAGGATIQSIGGKVIDRVGYNFTVTNSVVKQPLVVASPAVNGTIQAGVSGTVAPVFSGTATPGADVKVVTAWGDNVGTVTADATTGAWSLTWNKSLKPATYAGGNTIQSINGVEVDRAGYRFTVQAAASNVVLTSPAIGGVISTGGAATMAPVFSGTGTEGARIEIVGAWGTDLGKGVVKDGVWEITWANQYSPSTYSGGLVKQYLDGQTTLHSSVPYNFTITK